MNTYKPLLLIILDGWGISPVWGGNAIASAKTPNMNHFRMDFPHTVLDASGTSVGLTKGEPGNSEVGHMNIGAGRIIPQDGTVITEEINNGCFFENKILLDTMQKVAENRSQLHLMGLVSSGGIHSRTEHLLALLKMAKSQNLQKVFIHMFCDGRDTLPTAALHETNKLLTYMNQLKIGKIATVCGRYYAMDRDNRWERTEKAYRAIIDGIGNQAPNVFKAISNSYSQGITDEFIMPTVIVENQKLVTNVMENDAIICFNFRADRARQITNSIMDKNFNQFPRKKIFKNLTYISMVPYEYEYQLPIKAAFATHIKIPNGLCETISKNHLAQLHIAETEKYAHITYFLNCMRELPFPGESRILVPSPKVATYDLAPMMSAEIITQKIIENLSNFDFIVANFANADMVGHTGNIKKTVIAVECLDRCLGRIIPQVLEHNGLAIITADHGNAENMLDPVSLGLNPEHTTNKVPLILISKKTNFSLFAGKLANIAPTILNLLDIKKPLAMKAISLLSPQLAKNGIQNG